MAHCLTHCLLCCDGLALRAEQLDLLQHRFEGWLASREALVVVRLWARRQLDLRNGSDLSGHLLFLLG